MKTNPQALRSAFLAAIEPSLIAWKKHYFSWGKDPKEDPDRYEIQHRAPFTLDLMITLFCTLERINPDRIALEGGGIADNALRMRWISYHSSRAILDVIPLDPPQESPKSAIGAPKGKRGRPPKSKGSLKRVIEV